MPPGDQTRGADLQPLGRTVDIAHRAADRPGFAQHVPRFERMADLQPHAARVDAAVDGEAELPLRLEPVGIEIITRGPQVGQDFKEIGPDEMGQHEAIVQRRAPAHQIALLRLPPEPRRQRPDQQLLRQAHPRFGRHFKTAKLQQPQSPGRPIGREHLVDADFGAVGVARHIDQQVAEQPIDQPWGRRSTLARERVGHLRQRDLQFIQAVVPRLVDARRLARRPDAQARKQVGKRRVPLPVEDEALEQVGPPDEGRIIERRAAQHDMIAPAGADRPAIDHELVGGQVAFAGIGV